MSTKRAGKVRVGDGAPGFALTSQYGETARLGDLIGEKAIVLYFYPKDDTPGCTAEACSFRDAYEDFVEAGAEVVGVSSDSAESHGRFAAGNGLPFILLSDDGGEVRRLYGVSSTLGIFPGRVTYVIDKGASSGTSSPHRSARQGTWTKPSRSCKPSTRSLRADELRGRIRQPGSGL